MPVSDVPRIVDIADLAGVFEAGDEPSRECEAFAGPDVSRETVRRLVDALPERRGFWYYDVAFPSPSDPGAHFLVWRDFEGLCVHYGNHGWGTWPQQIGAEDVADHVWACLQQEGVPYADRRVRLTPPGFRYDHYLPVGCLAGIVAGILRRPTRRNSIPVDPRPRIERAFRERLEEIRRA